MLFYALLGPKKVEKRKYYKKRKYIPNTKREEN